MTTTLTIAKREFRSYFDSPLAYVVICLGLVLLGAFFFLPSTGFWQTDRATLAPVFFLAPRGLSIVVVPVLTMRLLAEERRSGTLEMLITLPVRDHEVILGKFLGAWGLVLILIGATALYPLMMFGAPRLVVALVCVALVVAGRALAGVLVSDATMSLVYAVAAGAAGALLAQVWRLGVLDSGPVLSGYLGLFCYSAAAVAIGLFISAVTESQVIAFFVTWALLVLLSFMGMFVEAAGGGVLRDVIAFISFDTRLAPFARGQIITRDVIYFLSIAVGCLMMAFRALERRKWA